MSRAACTVMPVMLLLVVGCAHPQRSVEEQNKVLVNRFGEASNAKDFDAVRELLAPDFVRHSQATPDIVVTNRDQFIDYLKADAAVFPDSKQTLEQLVAEGDLVAFRVTYEGTQEGPMGPFPPSHKKMQLDVSGIFRISGGKLAELWVTWDNLAALAQLGHFPPPPTKQD
ncbi:MAG: ester cyclase [Micromonosporaceae bacterium]